MGDLRIGVQSLPAAEAGLVRALLQLMAHGRGGLSTRWTFAERGPFDALVTDISAQHASLQPARAVLRLAHAGAEGLEADVVPRPLRADAFERWLAQVSERLADPEPPEVPAVPVATAAPASPRWKLRRWPPSELLRADPERVRLATMLSRRPLSTDELAQLAHVAPEKCRVFVQLLQSFELLAADTPVSNPVPVVMTPVAAAPAAPARWSLVTSIRRKLGLGGPP